MKKHLAPDQITKLKEIMQEASRLGLLFKQLERPPLFCELSTEDRLANYGACPEQYQAMIEMD